MSITLTILGTIIVETVGVILFLVYTHPGRHR